MKLIKTNKNMIDYIKICHGKKKRKLKIKGVVNTVMS